MSVLRNPLLVLVLTAGMPALPYATLSAFSGAENLKCDRPFKKVNTIGNSIKCKTAKDGLRNKRTARTMAAFHAFNADCNAHQSRPKTKVWKKQGKWAYRVTFICAIIY